jgi:hypothetical protein
MPYSRAQIVHFSSSKLHEDHKFEGSGCVVQRCSDAFKLAVVAKLNTKCSGNPLAQNGEA